MRGVRITIVITDRQDGPGCTVQTDSGPIGIGEPLTDAQLLARQVLAICNSHAASLQHGTKSASLAGELLEANQE